MDPRHFEKLDPDPHQRETYCPDPDQSEKQAPDPHQSDKIDALEGQFGTLEGPNLENSCRIWIRIKSRKVGSGSVSK
jgi:hypothetical protein